VIDGETELAMALRHVAEAERHIRRQSQRVLKLEADGQSFALAQQLLEALEKTLKLARRHVERLQNR
jgi:hypothetical protein